MAEDNKSTVEESQKKRCFVMMPFSDPEGYTPGHFRKVYDQIIKPAIEKAGYEAYHIDENSVSDLITTKIFQAILDCDMAVCDLSSRNPNVLYELGIRHAFDKPVVLINDDKTERIFDVQGLSTITYRSSRLYDEVPADQEKIIEAIKANKDSGSSYSIINIVKLQKATYDKDDKDINSSELNNALLMRIVAALDKTEQNPMSIKNQWIYEKESIEIIDSEISNIIESIYKLKSTIENALKNNLCIDTPQLGEEINHLFDKIGFYLKSTYLSKRQHDELLYRKKQLNNVLDKLYLLEEKYVSEENHS